MDPLDFGELEDLDKLLMQEGAAVSSSSSSHAAEAQRAWRPRGASFMSVGSHAAPLLGSHAGAYDGQMHSGQGHLQHMQHQQHMQQQHMQHMQHLQAQAYGNAAHLHHNLQHNLQQNQHSHGNNPLALDYQIESEDSDDGLLRMTAVSSKNGNASALRTPGASSFAMPISPAFHPGAQSPLPPSLSMHSLHSQTSSRINVGSANIFNSSAKSSAADSNTENAKKSNSDAAKRTASTASSEDKSMGQDNEDDDDDDANNGGGAKDGDKNGKRTGKFDRIRKSFREKQRRAEHSEIFTSLARTLGMNPRQQRGELLQAAVNALNSLTEENRMLRSHMVMMQARAVATIESFTGMPSMYGHPGMGSPAAAAAAAMCGGPGMPGMGMPGMMPPGFFPGAPYGQPHMGQHGFGNPGQQGINVNKQHMQQAANMNSGNNNDSTDQVQKRRRLSSDGCSPGACGTLKPTQTNCQQQQQQNSDQAGEMQQTQEFQKAKSLAPRESNSMGSLVPPMHMMAAMMEQEDNQRQINHTSNFDTDESKSTNQTHESRCPPPLSSPNTSMYENDSNSNIITHSHCA
mmetsp:Transcript_561/g.1437  ORF Transcript_561/g.1437 Transcript_561/m.1437 type:complete len:572 (+) Transcript_561:205-1920(+)